MDETPTSPIDRARVLELIDNLAHGWADFMSRDATLGPPRDARHPLTPAVVVALASHTTELGRVVAILSRSDLSGMAVMPAARSAYETGLTAHWLAQSPHGFAAWFNKNLKQARALANELENAQIPSFRNAASALRAQIAEDLPLNVQINVSFQSICQSLELAKTDAYAYYRLACGLDHPGTSLVERYLEEDADSIQVRGTSKFNSTPWLFMTAASMVWAQMGANFCDPERTRRDELRSVARELNIPDSFQLTHEGFSPPSN